jgi:formylglycine-generating enzyme required for sulfatase activity
MPAKTSSRVLLPQLALTAERLTHAVLIIFFLYVGSALAAPVVSNLTASQRAGTKLVDIRYDLSAPDIDSVSVSLQVSSDGGASWTVPVRSASGAIGTSVAPGAGKTIVWNAETDWPRSYTVQMRFMVTVADYGSFSFIPDGSFTMGRTSGDTDSDAPPVSVTVSGFYIQRMETTKAEWDDVRSWALSNGYTDLPTGDGKASNHPVQTVNWWDVLKWCNARSEKEGVTPVYTVGGLVMRTGEIVPDANWTANGYRLPTEAEWEKSARGELDGKRFPWGTDTINHSNANYIANSISYGYDTSGFTTNTHHPTYNDGSQPYTSPVGSFAANGYALYDMAGNVWEWCWDRYGSSYYSTIAGAVDPRGPSSGTNRLARGGGWINGIAMYCRAANRGITSPSWRGNGNGFRSVRKSIAFNSDSADAQNVTVDSRDSQTITFDVISDKLTTASFNLNATGGGSGNPVTFTVPSGPGVITNNVLTFTTSGSVTVTASQAGNANYFAAEDVSRTFNVTKAEAPIAFGQLIQVTDGSPRAVSVSTTPAQLTVNLTYADQTSPPSLPGTYEVSATVDDLIYRGTSSATLTVLGLSSLEQPVLSGSTSTSTTNGTNFGNVTLGRVLSRVFTITNPAAAAINLTGTPLVEFEGEHAGDFVVSLLPDAAVPASGLASFELRFAPTQPGIREARVKIACTGLANGPITFALQGFGALPTPRSQTITFNPPATLYLSQLPLTLSATASSGLPVELRLLTTNATLGQDGLLTVPLAGTLKVEARQAGDGSFAAASSVQRTIAVKPDPTGLTLVDLVKTYNGQPQEAGVVGAGDADVAVTYKVVGVVYRTEPPTLAGQYAVKAVAGTVTKTGTLIINPAPLYMNVEDKRRLVGEANPALTVIFDGFIGDDTLGEILLKPINLATTATPSSPVGSYPITSSGGAVTANYKLVHRTGTLVVEGVAGSYEALLKHPEGGLPNGHLALTVPGASRTFTASLRLGMETAAIAWNGSLSLSAQSRLATATMSKTVSGVVYELKVVLSMFGELNGEVRRAGVLVAAAEDGIRLLSLPTGQKSEQEGLYTAVLEPAQPAGESVPAGAGWATVKVDATGKMTLIGRLPDGTAFTAGLAADVAGRPGYRLFVQPYVPLRKDSHFGGSFTLVPHPRLAGKSYVAGSNLTWVKAGQLKDLGYRSGFGPVTSTLRISPWQPPTTTNRLAARLELGVDGRWELEHSSTGSLSHEALPMLVGVSATNVVSVVAPLANTRKWKVTLTPTTGAYMGTFELLDLTEMRKVSFSGVLRQTPTTTDELIGAGQYLLPALKTDQNKEQKSGAVLFWRPE